MSDLVTPLDLDALEKLVEAGSRGPWKKYQQFAAVTDSGNGSSAECYGDNPSENAALIVAAVNALPDLIAELVSLRMERAAVSEAGEALFSLAFGGAGREHLDHGAEPFSSLATCSDVICRSRAEVLLAAVAEGIATMRPDDEWLVAQ